MCPSNDDRVMVDGTIITNSTLTGESENHLLAILCDGVGGYAFGDEAAQIASEVFADLAGQPFTIEEINIHVTTAIEKANNNICEAQAADTAHNDMASTIAGVYVHFNDFFAFNIGDSRIYRFRDPYISQLSADHTEYQMLLDNNYIDKDSEPNKKAKNTITRFSGHTSTPEATVIQGENRIFAGDVFLICSDGLSDVVIDEEIENLLTGQDSLMEKCRNLFDKAIANGSLDNISIILIEAQ